MEKRSQKTPEEIAKDLENIDFAEIVQEDLLEVFGGLDGTNSDCNCGCPPVNGNCGCSGSELSDQ